MTFNSLIAVVNALTMQVYDGLQAILFLAMLLIERAMLTLFYYLVLSPMHQVSKFDNLPP